jgi:predicted dehydrogenase
MARDLRGGLIGCGFFAENQLHAWKDIPGVNIVALCDRDVARAMAMAARTGVAAHYGSAAEMMAREGLDFVDIVTQVDSHRDLVELAAAHSLPVICQKPFARSLEDAQAMVDMCEAAGVPLMVHENFRWQTPILAVRKEIAAGSIGEPFFARLSFRSAHDVYAAQPYLAEGPRFIIEDLGIHILDVARSFMGEVEAITCRTQRINPAIKGEDAATLLLSHVSGAVSVVDCSYATRSPKDPFPETLIEVDGDSGGLRLLQDYRLAITNSGGVVTRDVSPPLPPWGARPWHNIQDSVVNIQRHWVDSLNGGRPPETSGRDNVRTLALVEAAYQSAARGETVRVG